ncbi:HEAT repeat domain-containing protein [Alkalihalophilus sp. As8PL]|uniref:HEAT repeat domain-containing protein n=1 Tax=Alkalihalophilus sp. As8PL TaxID=3237103 RepID=A0AB39BV44_9BACI
MSDMIQLLILIIIGLGSALSIILIYLLVNRLIEKRKLKRLDNYYKEYSMQLYRYLVQNEALPNGLRATSPLKVKAIEYMLSTYINHIHDQGAWLRISQYADDQLAPYYQKALKSRKWSRRMNALYRMVDYRMESLIGIVDQMIQTRKRYSQEEYFQMYKLLASVNHPNVIKYLIEQHAGLSENEYRTILTEIDSELFKEILCEYERLPPIMKSAVIDVIGMKNRVEYIELLEKWLGEGEQEIRIRIMKAVCKIGYVHHFEHYIPFIESTHWEERMLMARLLGVIYVPEVNIYLRPLMNDSSWWVRQQAARSLIQTRGGKEVLEEIISSGEDRYAIDIAGESLRSVRKKHG